MSGHSKWHNIQKTKGAQDAKRAAAFTKISKEMIVAVKEGGGIADPAYNSRLATVITKAKAALAVEAFIEAVTDSLKKGEDVALVGFGTFTLSERAARTGRNPRTKESMVIPATRVPTFKASKALRDTISK